MTIEQIAVTAVSDIEIAFGTVSGLPKMEDIPVDFKSHRGTFWNNLFCAWFFNGISKLEIKTKEGINESDAIRHIRALMCSCEPKQEHKEAGISYLMSCYFASARWEKK